MKLPITRLASRAIFAALFFFLAIPSLFAHVTRIEISSRVDVLDGKSFGDAGPYERITGKIFFSVSLANPHNQAIVDLSNAVDLYDGEVAFSGDFVAVRPKDRAKGNGTMLLENPNRGFPRILSLVDGGDEDLSHDAGDAWLLCNGFTIVSLGWQWDAVGPGALHLFAPIAKDHGKTITGLLRGDLMLSADAAEVPLGHLIQGRIGGSAYPPPHPNRPPQTPTTPHTPHARPNP